MTLDLSSIRERVEKATPGEWEFEPERGYFVGAFSADGVTICTFGDKRPYYPSEGEPPNEADAAFIAHARSDIPALLDEVERLREALEAIQRRARSDGSRTFDDTIRDLELIDDLCRAALTEEQQQGHRSDCATHNAPAMPAGPCDCGTVGVSEPSAETWLERFSRLKAAKDWSGALAMLREAYGRQSDDKADALTGEQK